MQEQRDAFWKAELTSQMKQSEAQVGIEPLIEQGLNEQRLLLGFDARIGIQMHAIVKDLLESSRVVGRATCVDLVEEFQAFTAK